jgi:transcriptional regulator with XRE-family HTH domain
MERNASLAALLAAASEGRSQDEVARLLGVHQTALSRWLRGEAPAATRARAIAEFLGISEAEVAVLIHQARLAVAGHDALLPQRVAALEQQVARLEAVAAEAGPIHQELRDLRDELRKSIGAGPTPRSKAGTVRRRN